MAITLTILQSNGNPSRSAMALLDFDEETVVPADAEITLTVEVLDDAGADVDEEAAITTTATAEVDVDSFAEAFLADIQAALTGAYAWLSKNSPIQYVIHIEAKHDLAQIVNLSAAGFDPDPE
jgi:hypothetical protein